MHLRANSFGQIDTLSCRVEQLSFFICQLGRYPVEAYASDPRRSSSDFGGADVHGAGPSTSYWPDTNFDES